MHHRVFLKAVPKVKRPKRETTLSAIGTGLARRMARGIEEPPSTIEASKANSTP